MRSVRNRLFIVSLLFLSLACGLVGPFSSSSRGTPEAIVFNPEHLNELKMGELRFLTEETTASEPTLKPVHGCWPSSYYDDGAGYLFFREGILEGGCSWRAPNQKNPDVRWDTEGFFQGAYDMTTGALIFHFVTKAVYPQMSTIEIIFDGTGFFTTPTHAEGTATFTSTCISTWEEPQCGTPPGSIESMRPSWNVTGTVPWTIDFPP